MSKQSEAKQEQGYRTDTRNCGACVHMKHAMKAPAWMAKYNAEVASGVRHGRPYVLEQQLQECGHRCGIGGFAIKKTATCDKWELAA